MTSGNNLHDRALNDTGVMCREVLGYDYDKDEETGRHKRPGGIREDGPHQQMVEFLDSTSLAKHLEAPRGSYKTTVVSGYCIRRVTKNPNLRVIYGMETLDLAIQKLAAIKGHFEGHPGEAGAKSQFVEVYGDLKTNQWKNEKFTISGRTDSVDGPSFQALGVDKNFTGSHADIIILDDLVTDQNIRTPDGIAKVQRTFKMVEPLLDPGGTLIVVGTRYHNEDLYGWILSNFKDDFEVLILDCGMQMEETEHHQWYLTGQPAFEHLTEDFLRKKLRRMGHTFFSSQYLNVVLSGAQQFFHRTQFKHTKWQPWMEQSRGYLLTDTAVSPQDEGCFSVIAIVLFDAQNCAYLADMEIGHWLPYEFSTHHFDMWEKWDSRIPLRGTLMEDVSINMVYKPILEEEARHRQIRWTVIDIKRHGRGALSKPQRIQRLQGRFERSKFVVIDDTMPREFFDLGERQILWDKQGHAMPDGSLVPAGELVDQFVHFPKSAKNDIPDALADIEAYDRRGDRICRGPSVKAQERMRAQRYGSNAPVLPIKMNINGLPEIVDIMPTSSGHRTYDTAGYWKDLAGRARR